MKRILGIAVVMMAACLPGYGQQATAVESKPTVSAAQELGQNERFWLAFVVRETDEKGKALNSRAYETLICTSPQSKEPNASIRAGARVPVPTSSGGTQFTYLDVGVNFDVLRFHVLSANRVAMNIHAEVSSVDPAAKEVVDHPIIRQNKWSGEDQQAVLGERKVIFSSDDLTSKIKLQVELRVTRVE